MWAITMRKHEIICIKYDYKNVGFTVKLFVSLYSFYGLFKKKKKSLFFLVVLCCRIQCQTLQKAHATERY